MAKPRTPQVAKRMRTKPKTNRELNIPEFEAEPQFVITAKPFLICTG